MISIVVSIAAFTIGTTPPPPGIGVRADMSFQKRTTPIRNTTPTNALTPKKSAMITWCGQ
jgi:hypothetical protein